jgi:hypothetical protein
MRLYIHYKGGRYLFVGIAETHEHNGDRDAVYISLTHGKMVTRPLQRDSRDQDSWTEMVTWPDGNRRQRFEPADLLQPDELKACFGEQS